MVAGGIGCYKINRKKSNLRVGSGFPLYERQQSWQQSRSFKLNGQWTGTSLRCWTWGVVARRFRCGRTWQMRHRSPFRKWFHRRFHSWHQWCIQHSLNYQIIKHTRDLLLRLGLALRLVGKFKASLMTSVAGDLPLLGFKHSLLIIIILNLILNLNSTCSLPLAIKVSGAFLYSPQSNLFLWQNLSKQQLSMIQACCFWKPGRLCHLSRQSFSFFSSLLADRHFFLYCLPPFYAKL